MITSNRTPVAALVIAIFMFGSGVQAAVNVTVQADIRSLEKLHGTVRYEVSPQVHSQIRSKTSLKTDFIRFLLYPNQFQHNPDLLPEYLQNWIYPNGTNIGQMRVLQIRVNDSKISTKQLEYVNWSFEYRDAESMIVQLPIPRSIPATASFFVEVDFTVTIPERRGRFGFHNDVLTLAGGWFPRLLANQSDENNLPLPLNLQLELTVPKSFHAFVVDDVFPKQSIPHSVAIRALNIDEAPLVLMKRMDIVRHPTKWGPISFISSHYLPTPKPRKTVTISKRSMSRTTSRRQYLTERTFSIAKKMASLLGTDKWPEGELFVIEVPTWDRLAQTSNNTLLLSQKTLALVPHPKAQLFHEADIAKNIAIILARQRTAKETTLGPLWAEVIGYYQKQQYLKSVANQSEELHQLLRFASFIPYVDNLIYAPQIPFEHVYTASIEEKDYFRAELWRTLNSLPRGKRILAKLEDRIGIERTKKLMEQYLGSNQSFFIIVEGFLESHAQFFSQWLGSYPRISYDLGKIKSDAKGDHYQHQVQVHRRGAPIVEPVTVQLTDRNGTSTRLVWNGEGNTGIVKWQSAAQLDSVLIDPERRLVETLAGQGHPLGDNVTPKPMRPPLLNQFLVWGDSVTLEPFVLANFGFKKKYDITNSFSLQAYYTPRLVGGAVGYLRHFGFNRTLNARSWYTGPTLSVYRYKDAAETEPLIPSQNRYTATMATISVLAGMDNRKYGFDPQSGKSFQINVGYSAGYDHRQNGVQNAKGGIRAFRNIRLSLGHLLAMYGGVSAVVGTPPASNLVSLSHRQVLRGFDLGETYGKLGLYGVMEYRHTLFGDTPITFPFGTHLNRIQGVLFTGIGSATLPGDYSHLFNNKRVFAEIGYGLRFHLLTLGVVPYLLAIDFAVPIFPRHRSYTLYSGDNTPYTYQRSPFRFVFGITQTY